MRRLTHENVLLPAIGAAVILGILSWFQGATIWAAIAIAVVTGALVILWRGMPRPADPHWADLPPEPAPGARTELQVLGLAVSNLRGTVQPRALERVRGLARGILLPHGIDLDNPADRDRVVALVGEPAYLTLLSTTARMPDQAALLACLDALDALNPLDHLATPRSTR